MDRKNKLKSKLNNAKRNEETASQIRELTDQLLKICTSAAPSTGVKLWDEHKSISNILEKIVKLEENVYFPVSKREDNFPAFINWISDKGIDVSRFLISYFNEESWGLEAAVDIQEHELWLKVPQHLMITSDDFNNSKLAKILSKDPISKSFNQVALALFLLQELLKDQSKYKPYLDILPSAYDTILYFSVSDLEELKGCACLEGALKHYRHIARQYAYYWQLFNKVDDNSFDLKNKFTFSAYRWAVSTVMTRQNAIPTSDGNEMMKALVPLWDMCNHSHGNISTDFNLETMELKCYASHHFAKGSQIFISYGERPNFEYFIHNAFVYLNNPNDKVPLKLGISKGDPLMAQKSAVLQNMGVNQNETFYITNGVNPISDKLLIFIRIFVMDEDGLKNWTEHNGENSHNDAINDPVPEKAWIFLKTRLELLLKAYKTSLKEDESLLEKKQELSSSRISLAVAMRLSEKRILHQAINYINSQCQA